MDAYFASFTSLIDARMGTKEASGQRKTIADLLESWGATQDELTNAKERDFYFRTGIDKNGRSSEEIRIDMEAAYEDTEYYQNMLKQREALKNKQEAYDKITQEIADLQAEIKSTSDKNTKQELKNKLSALKKEQKQLKLSNAEKKTLQRLEKEIDTYARLGSGNGQYEEIKKEYEKLADKQAEYDEIQKEIIQKKEELTTTYGVEDRKRLTAEIKQLQNEAKKKKLTAKEQKLLAAYKQQLEGLEGISQKGLIDQAVANTATYQDLISKIADLQAKKAAGKKIDETKLAMYLDEVDAIGQGILASSIASYVKIYEEW